MKLVFSISHESLLMDKKHYWAKSGPFGKGPLPVGEYKVGSLIDLDPKKVKSGFKVGSVSYWIKLTPMFETVRKGLGIHPDGNINGTLGCIGLQGIDAYRFQLDWKRLSEEPQKLVVIE